MSPTASTDSTPAWNVTGQTEQMQPLANGTYVPGVSISFVTRGGHSSSVFVPQAQYTPDFVRDAINTKAQTVDAIGALSG